MLEDKRESRFKRNVVVMLICQILTIGTSFLLIPITMGYIGVSDYGVWITLVGIIEWFNLFDIGLGHGLRNRYAEAIAKDNIEEVKKYVSTSFFVLLFISIGLFVLFIPFSLLVDWPLILNTPPEMALDLKILALSIGSFFCTRFVVNIVNILLTADQHPAIVAVILLLGNIISLCTVYFLTKTVEGSILWLGIALSASQLLPLLVSFFYFFSTRYRRIIPRFSQLDKVYIGLIFSLGVRFFMIQITAMLLFTTNNLIIAHVCGTAIVTEFNVAYKYMNIIFMVFMTMLTPLWSACTEAFSRGDRIWIEKTFRQMNRIWMLLVVGGIILVMISPFTYWIWLKDKIQPDFLLLLLMFVYMILWMRYTLFRTLMNGTGKIRLQFYVTSVEALLHIPLAIFMGEWLGVYGVIIVMILWAAINSVWEPIQYKRILNYRAYGIWNR